MRTIVAIYGQQLRGKSSVARILLEMLPGFVINPLAAPVKEETAKLLGVSLGELEERKSKDPKVREMLQAVGQGRRTEDSYYWLNKNTHYPGSYIVDDVRYENEIDGLIDAADVFYLIKVKCPRSIVIAQDRGTPVGENHISETELAEFDAYDLGINNDRGFKELRIQASFAAYDVLSTMQYNCMTLQRRIMDPFLGMESEDRE